MWNFISISQVSKQTTLEPIPQNINGNKYFCFDIEQSRFIATKLENEKFKDSLIGMFEIDITRYQKLMREKERIITHLETKIDNLNTIKSNDQLHIEQLNNTIKKKDKQLKRGKFLKWLLGTGLAVVTGVLIIK
jgi:hypothetical protein